MFDLYLLPLNLKNGQEFPDLSGFLAVRAPRRAERSRTDDILIYNLKLVGGTQPSADEQQTILDAMAQAYFTGRGPVTTGLRSAVEQLNNLLLNFNQRLGRGSEYCLGLLNLAVLRHDLLYIVHSGPVRTLLIKPNGTGDFFNPAASGRGLGLSKSMLLTYFQGQVEVETILIFCTDLPAGWTVENLASGARPSLSQLRRRLISQPGIDFQAAVLQFKPERPGQTNEIHRLRPKLVVEEPLAEPGVQTKPESQSQVEDEASPVEVPARVKEVPDSPEIEDTLAEPEKGAENWEDHINLPLQSSETSLVKAAERVPSRLSTKQKQPTPPRSSLPKPVPTVRSRPHVSNDTKRRIANVRQNWQETRTRFSLWVRKFLARILPGASDQSPHLSPAAMFFIAVAVPLAVVAAASTVYLRNGRTQQHNTYLAMAEDYANQAANQSDPVTRQNDLKQSIYWLNTADEYGQTDTSRELRTQVVQILDGLDAVTRLNFLPAFPSGFASTVNITHIAANDTEAFLLDSSSGRVIRLFLTGNNYDLDTNFQCSPGASGGQMIGALVDILALPQGDPSQARILAIDGNGNVLKCIPNQPPLSSKLVPPENGWGKISAFMLDEGSLYVMDNTNNSVYIYEDYFNNGNPPKKFFDPAYDEETPDISNTIDLAVNGEDLYMLNRDGTMILCHYGLYASIQTRCTSPAPFGDQRPGRPSQVVAFPDANFSQIALNQRLEPSLYLLDAATPAIYQLSLQLNFNQQFQPALFPQYPLPGGPASAFAVSIPSIMSPSRVIFLAYHNQIYYADLP
jgi:hypothetical protein